MNLYEACKILSIWPIAKARAEVWSMSHINDSSLIDLKDRAKTAFRRLALKYHPDKGGNQSKYLEIQEAFNLIKGSTGQSIIEALNIEKNVIAKYCEPGAEECWECVKWSSMIHSCLTIQCTGLEVLKKKFKNIRGCSFSAAL